MPVMDGYQATTALRIDVTRFHDHIRSIPVVAMTASANKGDRELCEKAGMNDFLSKPIVKEVFKAMMLKWTGKDGKFEGG